MKRLKLDSQMNSKHFEPVVGGGYVFEISLEFEETAFKELLLQCMSQLFPQTLKRLQKNLSLQLQLVQHSLR